MNDSNKKLPQPPKWAERLLEWLAAPHLLEEVQGDLQELFEKRLQHHSLRKARLLYVLDLLKLIHPRLWKTKPSMYTPLNPIDMFQHYLLLSFRTFKRFKGSFFINLIGLSTGLACSLLIYLWVNDELSFDKFHEKDSQLYQVMEHKKQSDGIWTDPSTSGLMAEALAEEMPEVEYATPIRPIGNNVTLSVGDNNIKATGQYVGQDYFKVFSYNLIQGNAKEILRDKNAIVISEELAMKLFGTKQNIVGKVLEFQHEKQFLISGIFETVPANSSEQFDFALSYELFKEESSSNLEWYNEPAFAYVTLKPGTNTEAFNKKIANYITIKTDNNITHRIPFIKRYSEKYLYGEYENGVQVGGRIEYVKLFSVIAIFIMLIACINFMNLSTAKASRRMKEVGIKKAVGADRKALIFQFLSESLLMTFISVLLTLLLVALLLPEFNTITSKSLSLNFDKTLVLSLLVITAFTGIIAGSYPALYLSGFNPVTVLKGKLHSSVGELWIRKGLVVFQFALSIILIVAVLVVYKQIEFVQTKNLGYDKDNIVWFDREGKTANEEDLNTFLSEINEIPGIVSASSISHDMTGHNWGMYGFGWEGKDPNDQTSFESVAVTYDMIETLGIQMKEGRAFSRDFGSDSSKIIFNEAAIKHMRLKDPIGKEVDMWGKKMQIIGVAKDFHFASLHEHVKPLMFRLIPQRTKMFMAKIEAGKERETIEKLEKFYQAFNPGFTFDYKFLDKDYQAQYEAEKRVSVLSRYFAGVAILISCLGLFGLASFTAERRRKEIGIRKVLGSSEFGIVSLLSGEFTRLVFIAVLIALPLSYLLAKQWLDNFAFSIDLEWWFFAGAGMLALLIAWLTVGAQALKAAKINPVQSLKNE